jgi:hypothetical protein
VCIVGEPTVRQRSLRPTGIDKANFPFLSSHVGRSRIEDPAIHLAPEQDLLTVFGKQLMHFAHVPACPATVGNLWPPHWGFVTLDFAGFAIEYS